MQLWGVWQHGLPVSVSAHTPDTLRDDRMSSRAEITTEPNSLTDFGLDDGLSQYRDSYGHVRLSNVQGYLDYDSDDGMALAQKLYREWVEDHEYVLLRRTETTDRGRYYDFDRRLICVKACKRGNDIANAILTRKMKKALGVLSGHDPSPDGCHTNTLFLTLTWDPKICPITGAWKNIGKEWNVFLSSLNAFYGGRIRFIRSWESFRNGYPHIHALIYFPNWKFPYLRHDDGTYRLPYELKGYLGQLWHSFIDVIAVTKKDVRNRLTDVLSYILKFEDRHVPISEWNEKEKLTMTAVWYFGLQQYAISTDWFDLTMHVRVIQTDTIQTDLDGNIISFITYDFVGIISGSDCKVGGDTWYKSFDSEPDWVRLAWIPRRMSQVRRRLMDMGFA